MAGQPRKGQGISSGLLAVGSAEKAWNSDGALRWGALRLVSGLWQVSGLGDVF